MPMPMLSTVLWWVVLGMLLGWLGSWMFNGTLRTRVAERSERAAAASIAADAPPAARIEPALALRTLDPDPTCAAPVASTIPPLAEMPFESATRDEWPSTIGHPPAALAPGPAPDATDASIDATTAAHDATSAAHGAAPVPSDVPPATSPVPDTPDTPATPATPATPTSIEPAEPRASVEPAVPAAPEPGAFDLAAAVSAGLAPRHADDLEVIDGIGARIAALLRDEGVTTWRMLADSSPERLRDLLDLGGPGFRIADPTSWPVQAALAADGRWADLKALQGLLAAGRG